MPEEVQNTTGSTPEGTEPEGTTPEGTKPEGTVAEGTAAEETSADAPDQGRTVAASAQSFKHAWNEPKPKAGGYFWGTGRRKRSIARVRMKPGDGQVTINGRDLNTYFKMDKQRNVVVAPLMVTDTRKRFNIFVNAHGGGVTGQAEAIVLGIARALLVASKEYDSVLRTGHYLTRDARKVERKKYGRRGARRSFQFSKR